MQVHHHIATLDALMERWREAFGPDFTAYRNHNYRVANFCIALAQADAEQIERIGVACVFHDLGVWTHRTLDYLEPSRRLAADYLNEIGRSAWTAEIEAMVVEHHKLRDAGNAGGALVEPFRRADWIDVSLGLLRFGLPADFIRDVRRTFPNAGFHNKLLRLTGRQLVTTPWRPMPMMRF